MNQIATRSAGSAVAALSNLKAGIQNVASSIVSRGGDPFLRLGRDGVWVFGQENIEVQEGSLWAVNPLSIQHGWVAWTDYDDNRKNEIVDEIMVPASDPLPLKTDLRDVGWKWAQQVSFQLRCLNGDDAGEQVMYKTTSVGGMNAIDGLLKAFRAQLERDIAHPVPVVALEVSHYTHNKWGKTYVPELRVVKWIELTDDEPEVEADPDADVKEAAPAATPKARTRASAAVPETGCVQPTAADRKAALQQALADLDNEEGTVEGEAVAPAPRRRRR